MNALAEKLGQLVIVGFEGLAPPPYLLEWLARGRIGGIILFARNIESPAQVKRLVAECRSAAKHPILVGIDQEGGIVARLRDGFTESPGAMALGASGDRQLAQEVARAMGRELAALGINWNYAPVADIAHNSENPSVGTRSVGRDPQLVSDLVAAQIRGFQRAGVAATVKHFPGLGNTVIDTHDGPARVGGSLSTLYAEDLLPFREAIAADVACVMLTHVLYEELDEELPATLSPRIVNGLLREELGYDGAVCTDCMEMKAITDAYGAGESALLALQAGCDLLLYSHTRASQEETLDAIWNAVQTGSMPEARIDLSLSRINAIKRRFSLDDAPSLQIVGSKAHRSLAGEAARAGAVLVKRGSALPITSSRARTSLIEIASKQVLGADRPITPSRIASLLSRRLASVVCHRIDPAADYDANLDIVAGAITEADIVVLVTRNAHLNPSQSRLARFICDRAQRAILICVRNPYDAGLINGADSVICTNGDSPPSLEAAVDAICGEYLPGGKLTVEI